MYTRRVLAGEFTIVNRQLVEDLLELGLWSPELKNKVVAKNGSIQGIEEIPQEIQELYKVFLLSFSLLRLFGKSLKER